MDEIIRMFGGAENIWNAIQTNAERVGIESTRVMLELFYVLKSPETSMINKTLIVTALGYQLLPEDVLPSGCFLLTFCIFQMLSGCVRTNRALLRMDLHDAEKGQNGRQKSLKNVFQGILSTVHKRKHHF